MIEPAIYVLIGVLATALVAMMAIPAISRRAFRLAEAQFVLLNPSPAAAHAANDALRARHAAEAVRIEQKVAAAGEAEAEAKIEAGRRAIVIAERDRRIAELHNEIDALDREILGLQTEARGVAAEIGAREIALFDYQGQREAAEARRADSVKQLADFTAEVERQFAIHAAEAERARAIIGAQQSQIAALTVEAAGGGRERRVGESASLSAPQFGAPMASSASEIGAQMAELLAAARIADRRAQAVLDGDRALRNTILKLGRDLAAAQIAHSVPRHDAAILAFPTRDTATHAAVEERRESPSPRASEK